MELLPHCGKVGSNRYCYRIMLNNFDLSSRTPWTCWLKPPKVLKKSNKTAPLLVVKMLENACKQISISGLDKNLNFCLTGTTFSLHKYFGAYLSTCPLGKWLWKVKSTCPWQLDRNFVEHCIWSSMVTGPYSTTPVICEWLVQTANDV
mgnify:FL=1